MTARADGYYWAHWKGGEPFLIARVGGSWLTFGTEDHYADDSETIQQQLVVIAGPLHSPSGMARVIEGILAHEDELRSKDAYVVLSESPPRVAYWQAWVAGLYGRRVRITVDTLDEESR